MVNILLHVMVEGIGFTVSSLETCEQFLNFPTVACV